MRLHAAFAIAIGLILLDSSEVSASPTPTPTPGSSETRPPDRTGVDQIAQPADPKAEAQPPPKRLDISYPDPTGFEQRKHAADLAWADAIKRTGGLPPASPAPYASVAPSSNQPGLSANDNNLLTSSTPSDANGAIGPNNYVEIVNQRVAAYSRSLALVGSTVDLSNFVNPNGRGGITSDPVVEWDQQASRWLYVAIEAQPGANYLLYGWSKSSDPTNFSSTGWCRWDISTGNDLEDYPKLGHDATSIVIGANLDAYPSGASQPNFVTATIFVFSKPANGVTGCSQPSANQFGTRANPLLNADRSPTATPVPANTTDGGANDYVLAAHLVGYAPALAMFHISYGKKGSPTLVTDGDLPVAAYLTPPSAPQGSSGDKLATLDTRLTQAVARVDPDASNNAAIWTQQTISESANPQPIVRWYELVPATKTVRQSGDANNGVGIANFNAAISPTIDGNEAVLQYNQSSSTSLATVVAQSRLSSTPLGQMDPVVTSIATIGTSPSAETDTTCSPCRWGDYSGATPDPNNPHTVWATGALTGTAPTFQAPGWSTRNFVVKTPEQPYCLTATIAAGYYHTLAVGLDGTVWAWGATGYGQIGAGASSTNQLTPTQVHGPGGTGLLTGISYVAAGQYHSVALRASDGTVWAWGNNQDGELGNNDSTGANQNTPVQVVYVSNGTPLTGISDIASHNSHSIAIRKSDGTVWAWGLNPYGQLGNSNVPLTQSRAAVQVMGANGVGFLTGIVKVAVGDNFSVALDSLGNVFAWGDDSAGQLGDNRNGFGVMSVVPIQVHGLNNVGTLTSSLKLAARSNGADALNSDNTLSAWGAGNQPSSLTPVIVSNTSGSTSLFPMFAIGAGVNNTYAVDYTDTTLWAWGDNTYGQIGDNTTTLRPSPTHVQAIGGGGFLLPVFYAVGGLGHSVAVLASGGLVDWGLNSAGQLGDGATDNKLVPYLVSVPAIQTPTSC